MIYQLYLDFIKNNLATYLIYLITLLYIPIGKIGLPHFYGKLLGVIKNRKMAPIKQTFIYLIGIWIFVQLLHIVSNHFNAILMPKFQSFVRTKMINRIIDTYENNYQELKLGEIIPKIITSPHVLQEVFVMIKDFIFKNILIIGSSFVYLYRYSGQLGFIYLGCILMILVISFIYVQDCKKFTTISENKFTKTHDEIEDSLSNLLSIYTSQTIDKEKKRIGELSMETYKSENKVERCNNKYRFMYSVSFVISFIVLNYYTFKLFMDKKIKLDGLTSIIIINYSILSSLMIIYYDTNDYIDTKAKIDLLVTFLDKLPSNNKTLGTNNVKTNKINVEIKNLNFKYNEDKVVFQNFNMNIQDGEKVIIMGSIGSGKSTLGKLIVRLQEHDSGHILVNGIDTKEIKIDKLRQLITYIPQHPKLFNRTLYENITYGLIDDIPESHIYKMIKDLELGHLVEDFKRLMHKSVGKYGSFLSGGQRQIVWLIRSLLKKSKFIILDEPTSSLDKKSKMSVLRMIEELAKTRTIVLISHDNSLLKYCSRLVVLNKGKIIKNEQLRQN